MEANAWRQNSNPWHWLSHSWISVWLNHRSLSTMPHSKYADKLNADELSCFTLHVSVRGLVHVHQSGLTQEATMVWGVMSVRGLVHVHQSGLTREATMIWCVMSLWEAWCMYTSQASLERLPSSGVSCLCERPGACTPVRPHSGGYHGLVCRVSVRGLVHVHQSGLTREATMVWCVV